MPLTFSMASNFLKIGKACGEKGEVEEEKEKLVEENSSKRTISSKKCPILINEDYKSS